MKSTRIVTGNTHPADTATPKSEPFYKLTAQDARHLYDLGVFSAQAYVLMIIRTHGAEGWKWSFKVQDFCQEWGIPKRTFYLAISKLKSLDLIHWEVKETITVWYGSDIAQDATTNTASVQKESSLVSKQKLPKTVRTRSSSTSQAVISINAVQDVAQRVQDVAQRVQDPAQRVQDVAQENAGTLANTSAAEASDSLQIFLKSLSDCEREIFLEFGRKKAAELPRQPALPDKWVAANFQDLYRQFQLTNVGQKVKQEAIAVKYDWENDPRLMDWLHQSYEGGYLWTQEDEAEREERSAFYSWAQQTNAYRGRVADEPLE